MDSIAPIGSRDPYYKSLIRPPNNPGYVGLRFANPTYVIVLG